MHNNLSSQSEKRLSTLPKLECDICLPDIEKLYDDALDIISYSSQILRMDESHRKKGSKQLLQPGRVVILSDDVSTVDQTSYDKNQHTAIAFQGLHSCHPRASYCHLARST